VNKQFNAIHFMNQTFSIAKKNLLYIIRDIKSWSIVFILPVAFIGIFALVFNTRSDEQIFKIAYTKNSTALYQAQFIENLGSIKNSKDKPQFEILEIDNLDNGKSRVQEGKTDAFLQFETEPKIKLYADTFNAKSNAVVGIISSYANQFFYKNQSKLEVISIVNNVGKNTVFTYLVPGLIVYGILNLLPQIIFQMSSEIRKQYTFRYYTAKVKSWQIILGHLLSQSVLAIFQTLILFTAVLSFGYTATWPALALALLVSIPTNLFTVGLGMVIVSSFKNDNLAANIGTLASVILGFLSGAFLTFPEIKIFGGPSLTSLIPSNYATEAFRKVLQFNKGLGDIVPELSVLIISSIVLILIGSWAYNKFQLKNLAG
jgi:ABC-2 type transport system permease protein